MASVEGELWNVFTYYTLYGNALDPELTPMVQVRFQFPWGRGTVMRGEG